MMMALEEVFQTTLDESALATARRWAICALWRRFRVPGSGFRVQASGSEPRTRQANPKLGTGNPEPISLPVLEPNALSWFLRR
jgi:hypothetical protein